MKRLIAIAVTALVAASSPALAQVSTAVPLAEVARKEEARRKTAKKATKVFTNANLASADASSTPAGATTTPDTSAPPTEPTIPLSDEPAVNPAEDPKSQVYWQKRISSVREALTRTQTFADAMQTKINSLQTDIPNLDYPARGVAEKQLNTALAELERLKREIVGHQKAITAIEDEARRANVPVGWLRPGA